MGAKFYICFYHDKRTYRSGHKAYREVRKINKRNDDSREGAEQFRVFYCDLTGGYHHTSISKAEMDRRQIRKEGGYGKHDHQKFESQRRRQKRSPKRTERL